MKHQQIIERIILNREWRYFDINKYTQDVITQNEVINEINNMILFSDTICDKLHNDLFFVRSKFFRKFSKRYSFTKGILSIIYNDSMQATR